MAKCGLTQGWSKGWAGFPGTQLLAVNAQRKFGISPPKHAGATGSRRSRRQVGPQHCWGLQKKMKESQ
jgi:hypothetical protein